MKIKSILAALLLIVAGVQTTRAQKMTVNLTNGKTVVYRVSQVESVTFDDGTEPNYESVDLGLPSGTLWATFNVGATCPEEYGDYFAWGETEPKSKYNMDTYKWLLNDNLIKYNDIDGKRRLDPEDDAATVNWGSEWKMPSLGQFGELADPNYTTSEWTMQNGVYGKKITSKSNGKSIFLPAAGAKVDDENTQGTGTYYWTCSDSLYYPDWAYIFYSSIPDAGYSLGAIERSYGLPVRPVSSAEIAPFYVKSIELNMLSYTIKVNKTEPIFFKVLPSYADNLDVVWESSDESIAKIEMTDYDELEVTAISAGTCTIICRATDGSNVKAECQITVVDTDTKEYVDLGLPSGTLWATCNVGAISPGQEGDCFAWGETTPKAQYNWGNYRWMTEGQNEWKYITKYTFADNQTSAIWYDSEGNFIGDGKTELDPEDDAATANWGSEWKMPTKDQCRELLDKNYNTIEETMLNGYNVIKVTSKTNGNSIFLPTCGFWSCSQSLYSDFAIFFNYNGTTHVERYRNYSVRPVRVQEDPHEYVDLGLPSGTLWATCNVGADSPEEYGDYFAWGETQPKEMYNWPSYQWMMEGEGDWTHINKYTFADNQKSGCWYDGDTFVGDGKKELNPEDDAATANWGGKWQMPSRDQCEELMNTANTTTEWTTQGGVSGLKVTSKTNGNSIFLPAVGSKSAGYVGDAGNKGFYWSRMLYTNFSDYGFSMFVGPSSVSMTGISRSDGHAVRPVKK